jgi:hypothetical protein
MDITKHLAKPIEVEIRGEKVQMKPLRTKHYLLVSRYQYLAIKSQHLAKENQKNGTLKELSKEEQEELFKLDLELAFLTLSEMFEGLTRKEFEELPMEVINEVMSKFWEINNPNQDELEDAKRKLVGK